MLENFQSKVVTPPSDQLLAALTMGTEIFWIGTEQFMRTVPRLPSQSQYEEVELQRRVHGVLLQRQSAPVTDHVNDVETGERFVRPTQIPHSRVLLSLLRLLYLMV